MTEKSALIIFVKYPQPGKVKTRLAARLGSELTAGLYKNMLYDLLNEMTCFGDDLKIFISEKNDTEKFKVLFETDHKIFTQSGKDIGMRMRNAIIKIFSEGYSNITLIGSDIPGVEKDLIKRSFSELSNTGAVIGPASDGGYYLIGVTRKHFSTKIFEDMKWSTSKVLEETIKILKKNKIPYSIIEKKRDIDTLDDLRFFIKTGSELKKWKNTGKYLLNLTVDSLN